MNVKVSTWKIAATALATMICLGGCQTVGSWLPQHDKVTDARNAAVHEPALNTEITPEQKINVQLAVAQSFEDENKSDQAAKIYLDVIKRDTHCLVAYHRLALLYSKKGEWVPAQKYFDLALKNAPKNAEIRCDLGYSLYLQHRDKEAEECLRQALTIDADYACAHNDLGLLLARGGRETDALQEFTKAGCNEAQAHANLGMAYSVENRLADAQSQYRLALAADPNLGVAKSGLTALQSVDRSIIKVNNIQDPALTASESASRF